MKKFSIIFAVIALFAAPAAQAATIDVWGNLGNLTATDSGTFRNETYPAAGYAFGTIPANSSVTFTYNFSGTPSSGSVGATGSYQYSDASNTYSYGSASIGTNGLIITGATNFMGAVAPADMPVLATADQAAHTTTITNFATSAAGFTTTFLSFLGKGASLVNVSYNVSAVPLPAALPLFGLALAGLAGYNRRRKSA